MSKHSKDGLGILSLILPKKTEHFLKNLEDYEGVVN